MDPAAIRRISVDYTITAARAFSSQLTTSGTTPFRFAYLSGAMVERDHNKKTWFANEALHIRVRVLCCFGSFRIGDEIFWC